jgi:hypothetical protein
MGWGGGVVIRVEAICGLNGLCYMPTACVWTAKMCAPVRGGRSALFLPRYAMHLWHFTHAAAYIRVLGRQEEDQKECRE